MRFLDLRWLNGSRIVLYGCALCLIYAAILVIGVVFREGSPTRADFLAFHSAGLMALEGNAADAYRWEMLREVQARTLGVEAGSIAWFLGWLNPPHFFFAVIPFALLPYTWAWLAWVIVCSLVFALAITSILPRPAAVVAAFSTPAVLFSLGVGQNGLLIAALLAWTLALLDRKPIAAGIALGLLTIKPQFGLLFPLVLALTGRWRVAFAAAASATVAIALSALAFGVEPWQAFLPSLSGSAGLYLTGGDDAAPRIQSVHAFVRYELGQETLAWIVHGIFAVLVAAVVLRLWLRRPEGPTEARAAGLVAGAFLVTPYAWLYDAPALAIAALFLARAGSREGFLPAEKILLIVACCLPAIVTIWRPYPLVAPMAWLLLLACAWRRDRAWRLNQARCATSSAGT